MSSPARSARPSTSSRRPSAGGPAARAAARRRAQIVALPAPGPTVAGNGVFALVVVGMLVGGMVLLLVLNTSLAQGAFEIGSLTKTQNQLAVQEQGLLQDVARAEAPESLQERADALGMVPVAAPVFLRLADGAVLGTPKAAKSASRLPATGALPTAVTAARTAAQGSDAAKADPAPASDAAQPDQAVAR